MPDKPEIVKPDLATKIEPNMQDLRQDLDALKEDLARLANTVSKTAKHGMRGAASEANAAAGEVSDWAEDQYLTLRDNIRAQPITACAIAAGMGFLFGQFLLRR